jgi:hypothetical protein
MPDPHKHRPSFRAPANLKAAAQEALKGQPPRDDPWTLNDIVVAALAMFVRRPKTMLRELEPFKPPRKRGRPRKDG